MMTMTMMLMSVDGEDDDYEDDGVKKTTDGNEDVGMKHR